MYKKVLKTTPSLFLRTLLRTVTPFLFFSLGKKEVGAIRLKSQKSERKSPFGGWISSVFSTDKGYISQKLFDFLFEDGIQLVTGLRVNMKNKLMPFCDRMMLRKRYIIETINYMLKNTAQIVHSRHRSVSNFIMNLISTLGAYCFFDNKPKALQGYCIEDTKQLLLF